MKHIYKIVILILNYVFHNCAALFTYVNYSEKYSFALDTSFSSRRYFFIGKNNKNVWWVELSQKLS